MNSFKFLLGILLTSCLFSPCTTAQTKVNHQERIILYIDLKHPANEPFTRSRQEIPILINKAIEKGELAAYHVDYSNNTEHLLSYREYKNRFKRDFDPELDSEPEEVSESYDDSPRFIYGTILTLAPEALSLIGIDQTTGKNHQQEFTQVNYVHFYFPGYSVSSGPEYFFSIKWNDFIATLEKHSEILYYTNSYGAWWRGNIFITNNIDVTNCYITESFVSLTKTNPRFKTSYYRKKPGNFSLSNYESTNYDYPSIKEKKTKTGYTIDKIVAEILEDPNAYSNPNNRFSFDWKEFIKITRDSAWAKNSQALSMSDAFRLRKFNYLPDSITLISSNGKFATSKADFRYTDSLYNSFEKFEPKIIQKFYTELTEGIFLGDPLNTHLNQPKQSISELAYEYVLAGKIKAYDYHPHNFAYEQPEQTLTIDKFIENASEYLYLPDFKINTKHQKGDTIIYNNKYYRFSQDIDLTNQKIPDNLDSIATPFLSKAFKPNELLSLELLQKVEFNKDGKKKRYKLQGIAFRTPTYLDPRGIEVLVGYIKWEDLRPLLISDPRAVIHYKSANRNLVELLENREFFSYLYLTGTLKGME